VFLELDRGVWNYFFPSEFCFSSNEEGRGVMMTTTMIMQEKGCGNWYQMLDNNIGCGWWVVDEQDQQQ
jgi:hypothetical protein